MVWNFIPAIIGAVKFIFTSQTLIAQAVRFVGGTLLSQLLQGGSSQTGPRISDLRVQVSTYGQQIPRVYGTSVRTSGNVIDKSDLLERSHKKSTKVLGISVGSQKWFTYSAHLALLLCEGELPQGALRRIWANGKVIFNRDEGSAGTLVNGGTQWTRTTGTMSVFRSITFYPGSSTQNVDPLLAELHTGENVPAYRHSAYVVIEGLELADWGNGVPNLEFEYETSFTRLADAVENIASFADVTLHADVSLNEPLRGFVVAQASSVWAALEPLAGTFSFDLISEGPSFRAVPRGRYMRAVLSESDFAARPAGGGTTDVALFNRDTADSLPDEVSITYMDADRDFQTNTQRAFRNAGYSRNKTEFEVAIVLTADEAREVAGRTLAEALASAGTVRLFLSERMRWLNAGNVIGVPIDGVVHAFRINEITKSPNGVLEVNGVFDDPLSYSGDITGASGAIPDNVLELPGDTILQPLDAPILFDDDDAGFYAAVCGTGNAWRGCEIYRANGVGSPLTFALIGEPALPNVIGDCTTTLGGGPTGVWDEVNTLVVELFGVGELTSATADEVLVDNANFAWIGDADGQSGEYINFMTAAPSGSPNGWTLSGLLRGRRGTEHAVASHGAAERFVLVEIDPLNRFDFGPVDWNVARTYRPVSVLQDVEDATTQTFTNTGEGKRPYSPAHLLGTRNATNDDIAIDWTRRTRLRTPAVGGGPVPLGEETESYEVDIYGAGSPGAVVRTLTSVTPSVNYDEAMQTADGHALGAAVTVDVYQLSGVRGRGHALSGTV